MVEVHSITALGAHSVSELLEAISKGEEREVNITYYA
jgi:hypothetical protein